MRIFLSAFLLISLSAVSAWSEELGTPFVPDLNKGNWSVSGAFSITQQSGGANDNETHFNLSTHDEYFVAQHFSVGIGASWDYLSSEVENVAPTAAIGPSVTYYFWVDNRWAAFVNAGVRFGLTDATVNSYTVTELGINYFLSQGVAVGPYFFYDYEFSHYQDFSHWGPEVAFSAYF